MILYIVSAREGQHFDPERLRVDRLLASEERPTGNGTVTERVYILLVEELTAGAVVSYLGA